MTVDEMDVAIRRAVSTDILVTAGDKAIRAVFLAGMAAAADLAGQQWRDGYRGDVNGGFMYSILRVANKLSIESGA